MTSFKIGDGSKLTDHSIQTIPAEKDDTVLNDQLLYTPEPSPSSFDLEMTQMSENALDNFFDVVESGRGDANFEQNFRESDFGAALEDHVEFSDEVEEIERQPLSVDSEMAHAQQREQELTRHVSQIAEEKPDNDNNWTSFLDITPDPTFASANVSTLLGEIFQKPCSVSLLSLNNQSSKTDFQLMPQIQMLSGLRFAFAEGTVFETGSSTTNGDPAVYVNHAECKRENQFVSWTQNCSLPGQHTRRQR